MFRELMPLIQHRPLTLTVVGIDDNQIQVNVIPNQTENDSAANKEIGYNHKKDVAAIPESAIAALSTPLCLTGTPDEIDAKLAETLTQFTAAHGGLQNNLDTAVAEIKKAVQAIDERERRKKEEKEEERKNKKSASPKRDETTSEKHATKDTQEVGLPSLFTAPSPAVSANDPATAETTKTPSAPVGSNSGQ